MLSLPTPSVDDGLPHDSIGETSARSLLNHNSLDLYLLDRGDRIQLDVFNSPEYSQAYQVLTDGTLYLPLVGTVVVQGLSIEQAAREIETQYSKYIRSPAVTLSLVEARPMQIVVTGEVHRPGAYRVPDDLESSLTVTQALQLAGGITQSADVRAVKVMRSPVNGADPTTYTINLWELLKEGDLAQDIDLVDGDSISVSQATTLESEEITQLANASFSPETITVYVVGEIELPGPVELAPNTPLNQALLAAGGFNNRAAQGEVNLVRLNQNGTVNRQAIEVDFSHDIDDSSNPPMREGDTIVVSRSGVAQTSDFATLLFSPLRGVLGLFNLLFD